MSHIFLSYSRRDIQTMRRLRDDLKAEGLQVWSDERLEPGTDEWKKAIEEAIKDAAGVAVIMSPEGKNSKWVARELAYADLCGVAIFPVLAYGPERDAIPLELSDYDWTDIRHDYSQVQTDLIPRIRAHVESKGSNEQVPPRTPDRRTQPSDQLEIPLDAAFSITVLGKVFGFTSEELVLNRQRRISPAQRKRVYSLAARNLGLGAIFAIGTVLLGYDLFSNHLASDQPVLRVGGILFCGLLALLTLFFLLTSTSSLAERVDFVVGPIERTGSERAPAIQVGKERLEITTKSWLEMNSYYAGQFRVYYVFGSQIVLSVEPVEEIG